MDLTGSEDIRVRKSVISIRSAFKELLLEMPYDKISVKKVCECALVNKTTFYRYYPTLDYLLEDVQREYASPYVQSTSGLHYPEDAEILVRKFMSYSARQGELYDKILSSGEYSSILNKLMDEMGKERIRNLAAPVSWNEEEWRLYMIHANESQIRLYKEWVKSGRSIPLENFIKLSIRLVCDGIRP